MPAARLGLGMLASHRQRLLQRLNPVFGSFPFRNLWPGTTPSPSQQGAAASLWPFQQWLCMVEGAALISVELEGLGMEEAARDEKPGGPVHSCSGPPAQHLWAPYNPKELADVTYTFTVQL